MQAIPAVLEGRDLFAGAQTGTGKTAGFTLPLLQILSQQKNLPKRKVRGLVLAPTRELAAQVAKSIDTYGKYLRLRSTVVFGGVNIHQQTRILKSGVDILVATPGRLLDHIRQGHVDMRALEILVLDEADRMLDMGFIHDIKRILAFLPKQRQTLLFSATFSNDIKSLAAKMLDNPLSIQVTPENTTTEQVKQIVHPVDRSRKRELLSHIITQENWRQVLVFTRTKHGANKLARQLDRGGIKSSAIHGDKSQSARTTALANFKAGKVRVLVATDIAARGLDIDKLPHVVNFDLPHVPADYVHRIGRTGRAGSEGHAVSLVCADENKLLRDIERLIKTSIQKKTIGGFEPDSKGQQAPARRQGPSGQSTTSRSSRSAGPTSKRPTKAKRRNSPKLQQPVFSNF